MTSTALIPPLIKTLSFSGLSLAAATAAFLFASSSDTAAPSLRQATTTSFASARAVATSDSTAKQGTGLGDVSYRPMEFNMVWPNNGTAYAPQTGDMIRGNTRLPGIPVLIEVRDPATGDWVTLSTTTSSTLPSPASTSSVPAYAWAVQATTPAFMNAGGVLRLRATPLVYNRPVVAYDFEADGFDCYFGRIFSHMDWINASSQCRSILPMPAATLGSMSAGATVLSTNITPSDEARTFISMVQPVSNDATDTNIGDRYYTATQAPNSLSEFKFKYGFQDNETAPYANGEVEATYYNKGDLGIGRGMHCRRFSIASGSGLACYVKNYADSKFNPNFGNDESGDLAAAIKKTDSNHFATVAMVQYDNSPRVDFLVYAFELVVRPPPKPPLIVGKLSPVAQLDNHGDNVAVPTNCLSCHGGSYSGTTASGGYATGARFLPFDSDPKILTFATGNLATAYPGFTQAAQAPKIRALNQMIFDFPQTPPDVKKHIARMYGNENATSLGPNYVQGTVPASWNGSPASAKLYREVVKPYCIGCHVSYPRPGATYDLFASYDNFVASSGSVLYAVCHAHKDRRMPAAEQTAIAFWKSPARAYLLNAIGDGTERCDP